MSQSAGKGRECVLLRSREGAFFEIPMDVAHKHALPAAQLQEALDYYQAERAAQAAGDFVEHTWRKMSW